MKMMRSTARFEEKYVAVVLDIIMAQREGQPVLVGTTSIEKSELLSTMLSDVANLKTIQASVQTRLDAIKPGKEPQLREYLEEAITALDDVIKTKGVTHEVLNARYHEQEAYIVSQAGVPGAVTIATNMAGRGTDIQLGGNLDMRLERELEGKSDKEAEKLTASITEEVEKLKAKALEAGGLSMYLRPNVTKAVASTTSCVAVQAVRAIRAVQSFSFLCKTI